MRRVTVLTTALLLALLGTGRAATTATDAPRTVASTPPDSLQDSAWG